MFCSSEKVGLNGEQDIQPSKGETNVVLKPRFTAAVEVNAYMLTGAEETELALDSLAIFRVGIVTIQHEMPTVASGNSSSSVHSLRSGL